jgi:4-carboxymuconolactone decarboxylase
MKNGAIQIMIMLGFILINTKQMNAQVKNQTLDPKEQQIVAISAFTANGDQDKLKLALISGLDAGLTINEIKEVIVQLYAYSGFPRSLNALNTFMAVLKDRKAAGKADVTGKEPTKVEGTAKYEQGRKTLEELTGQSQSGPLTGANAFAPGIDTFLKEHLFADIFGRGVLTYQQRELATITTLATIPGLGSQLGSHIGMGMNIGLTEAQLRQAFQLLGTHIGKAQADAAEAVLAKATEKK